MVWNKIHSLKLENSNEVLIIYFIINNILFIQRRVSIVPHYNTLSLVYKLYVYINGMNLSKCVF